MDLNETLIFTRVVQAGSFTLAARQLSMPKSTVSSKVSLLEKRLGVTLLKRTTRKLHLTQAGEAYFREAVQAIGALQSAEDSASRSQAIAQGLLRVTAPVELGSTILRDLVIGFRRKCPDVTLDFVLTDRVVDLVAEGIDVAIRAGDLEDSSLIARRLGNSGFILVASATYLKKRGTPTQPRQLSEHDCLRFLPIEEGSGTWTLTGSRGRHSVAISGGVSADHLPLLKELAIASQGIALLPRFHCAAELRQGKLVRVLAEWGLEESPMHAVYPAQRFVPPKLQAFLDHLVEEMKTRFI